MTVIAYDEVEQIVPIIDELCTNGYSHPVSYYKEKYHLSNDEYSMIFDLAMPFIRLRNEALFWRNRYAMMRNHIFQAMDNIPIDEESDIAQKIRRIIKEEYEITSAREMTEEDGEDEPDED